MPLYKAWIGSRSGEKLPDLDLAENDRVQTDRQTCYMGSAIFVTLACILYPTFLLNEMSEWAHFICLSQGLLLTHLTGNHAHITLQGLLLTHLTGNHAHITLQ